MKINSSYGSVSIPDRVIRQPAFYHRCLFIFLLGFPFCLAAQSLSRNDSIHQFQRERAVEAQRMMKAGQFEDAIGILEETLKKNLLQDSVRDLLEALYIESLSGAGKHDSALRAGKDWAQRNPYSAKPHVELYKVYYGLGDYFQAAHQLELCLMRKPGDVVMMAHAAMLYFHSEELEKGERLSKHALELAKKPSEKAAAISSKALFMLKKKEYEQALILAKEAIAEDISYPESFYVLGLTYARLGRNDLVCAPLLNAIDRQGGPWCQDFYETRCLGK